MNYELLPYYGPSSYCELLPYCGLLSYYAPLPYYGLCLPTSVWLALGVPTLADFTHQRTDTVTVPRLYFYLYYIVIT